MNKGGLLHSQFLDGNCHTGHTQQHEGYQIHGQAVAGHGGEGLVILELNHRLGTTKAELNSFIQEWRNQLSETMVTVDRNLTSVKKEYDKVARLIEYVYLRAPCEAVVHEIASFPPAPPCRRLKLSSP